MPTEYDLILFDLADSFEQTKNTIFRNPDPKAGDNEPFVNLKDDGRADMSIDSVWERRGIKVTDPRDYHL